MESGNKPATSTSAAPQQQHVKIKPSNAAIGNATTMAMAAAAAPATAPTTVADPSAAMYRPAQAVHDWYEVGSMRSNTIGNPSIGTR